MILINLTGSRSALVNMEARGDASTLLNRKCVFIKWSDLDLDKFLGLIERGAGAIVVLLPPNMEVIGEETMKVRLCETVLRYISIGDVWSHSVW